MQYIIFQKFNWRQNFSFDYLAEYLFLWEYATDTMSSSAHMLASCNPTIACIFTTGD